MPPVYHQSPLLDDAETPEEANKRKVRERSAQWRAANPERHRENARRSVERRKEEVREYKREHYQRNREHIRAKQRQWRKDNPERARDIARADGRRRYLARDSETYAYAEMLRDDPCSYCGAPPPSAVDHIVPLSRGGANAPENLTATCIPCNSRKRSKSLLQFLTEQR